MNNQSDDKTPQGKIARGCMYVVIAVGLFLLTFGVVVPLLYFVGETVEHFTP